MLGFLFAFLCAVFKGIQSIYNKKNSVESGEYVSSWAVRTVPIFVVIPFLLYKSFSTGLPNPSLEFMIALLISGVINIIATIIKLKAFKLSDVSLITPISSLSPGLVVISSFFILGELPALEGIIGIVLVIVGAYSLNLTRGVSLLEPVISLSKNTGVQLMFLVILLYSISSSYDKIGVQDTSALYWILAIHLFISPVLFFVMIRKEKSWRDKLNSNKKNLIIMGLLSGFALIFQMLSLDMILVSYTISIKRGGILISVILAWFILGERENILMRIIGAILMVIGATIMTLLG
jgi:uncharacterized membrane protein